MLASAHDGSMQQGAWRWEQEWVERMRGLGGPVRTSHRGRRPRLADGATGVAGRTFAHHRDRQRRRHRCLLASCSIRLPNGSICGSVGSSMNREAGARAGSAGLDSLRPGRSLGVRRRRRAVGTGRVVRRSVHAIQTAATADRGPPRDEVDDGMSRCAGDRRGLSRANGRTSIRTTPCNGSGPMECSSPAGGITTTCRKHSTAVTCSRPLRSTSRSVSSTSRRWPPGSPRSPRARAGHCRSSTSMPSTRRDGSFRPTTGQR